MEGSTNMNSTNNQTQNNDNSSAAKLLGERKNFMKPQFENPVEKREKFAVSLRKKKTQEIVKAKRRKIIEALSKGKMNYSGFGDSGNAIIEIQPDNDLTVEQMEQQFYQGYPEWRRDNYKAHGEHLVTILGQSELEKFQKYKSSEKIQYILNLLATGQNLGAIEQLTLITKIRQEMSTKDCPLSIKEILAGTDILSICSQILSLADNQNHLVRYMKLEATWILTNIGYGDEEDLQAVFDPQYSISSHVNRILKGSDLQLIDQCIWLCANTAGESLRLRNMILSETHIIDNMSRLITESLMGKKKILKGLLANIMWCCSNLARKWNGNSSDQSAQPPMDSITAEEQQKLLYIIRTFMDCEEMSLSMQDALWAISYLLQDCEDAFITQVCQGKTMIQNLIRYMKSHLIEEYTPSLRAVGNILTSSQAENIDLFIFHGGLGALNAMMTQDQQQSLMKECIWCLSNITAGTDAQIAAFLNHQDLVEKMFLLANSNQAIIRRESLYIMTNLLLTTKSQEICLKLVQYGDYLLIRLFCQGLAHLNDANIVLEILQALEPILLLDQHYKFKGEATMAYKLEAEGGLDKLEELQKHPNIAIYQQIEKLISNFFGEDDAIVGDSEMNQPQGQLMQPNGQNDNQMFSI